jgi:hypothetical protein
VGRPSQRSPAPTATLILTCERSPESPPNLGSFRFVPHEGHTLFWQSALSCARSCAGVWNRRPRCREIGGISRAQCSGVHFRKARTAMKSCSHSDVSLLVTDKEEWKLYRLLLTLICPLEPHLQRVLEGEGHVNSSIRELWRFGIGEGHAFSQLVLLVNAGREIE